MINNDSIQNEKILNIDYKKIKNFPLNLSLNNN